MRKLSEAQQRQVVLRRAPDLALSGDYQNAHEIAMELKREGIDVRLHFSAATCEWLNDLCQRARQAAE